MSGKLVSVIVPVRDDGEVFKLLQQTREYEDFRIEVIVIANGASLDFLKKLSSTLAFTKSHSLISLPLADIAAARNAGIKSAVGRYVLFLDSDCTLPPEYFVNLLNYLDQRRGILLGRGPVNFISRDGLFSKFNSKIRARSYNRRKGACYAPNLIVSASIFSRVRGFFEGIGYSVDTEWGRRAELSGYKIEHLPTKFFVNHIDDSSALKTIRTWFYYGVGRAFREKRNYLLGRCGRFDYIRSLFPASNLIDRGDSLIFMGFVTLHYFVRTLGILHGIFFRWRKINLRFLKDAGLV